MGANLPKPLQWVANRTKPDLLHPHRPPSMLSVEPPDHTRYRKLVSSVFTTRAVAALRERVQETANALLDASPMTAGTVDVVGTVLLAAAGHGDRRHPRCAGSDAPAHPAFR